MSEITAAAIGYSNEVKPQTEINVLFVAINDYECDAAVCRLKGNQIEYHRYFHENLLLYEKKSWNPLSFLSFTKTDQKEGEKIKKPLTDLLDKVFRDLNVNKNHIKDIVLIGDSQITVEFKTCISHYFKEREVIDCTSGKRPNIIAEGSAIFCKSIYENNSDLSFDITEVAFHSLHYYSKEQCVTYGPRTVVFANTKLSHRFTDTNFQFLRPKDFPINIGIYQDKMLTAQFRINGLPSNFNDGSLKGYEIILNFNNFGEISLSFNLTRNQLGSVAIEGMPIRLGLTQIDLIEDKKFIEKFDKLSKESRIESERKSMFEKSKKELSDRYLEIKKRVESTELGRLKKKKIEEQLKNTMAMISSNDTELKTITNQISLLEDLMKLLN